jgi:hypothetical protein
MERTRMKARRLGLAAALALLVGGVGSPVRAQGFGGQINQPAVPPILNLNRLGAPPGLNYYNIYQPQIQAQSAIAQLQQQAQIQYGATAVGPGANLVTGHPVFYGNYSHFYATRGLAGVGASAGGAGYGGGPIAPQGGLGGGRRGPNPYRSGRRRHSGRGDPHRRRALGGELRRAEDRRACSAARPPNSAPTQGLPGQAVAAGTWGGSGSGTAGSAGAQFPTGSAGEHGAPSEGCACRPNRAPRSRPWSGWRSLSPQRGQRPPTCISTSGTHSPGGTYTCRQAPVRGSTTAGSGGG